MSSIAGPRRAITGASVIAVTPDDVTIYTDAPSIHIGHTSLHGAGDTDAERAVNLLAALLRAAELLQERIEDRAT